MTHIEVLKQAVDALENLVNQYYNAHVMSADCDQADQAVTALRQAIEQAEKQEPVAWKPDRSGKYLTIVYKDVVPGDEVGALHEHPKCVAMSWSNALHDVDYLKNHTHPQPKADTSPQPQKPWVGLSQRDTDWCIADAEDDPILLVINVERVLREQNT